MRLTTPAPSKLNISTPDLSHLMQPVSGVDPLNQILEEPLRPGIASLTIQASWIEHHPGCFDLKIEASEGASYDPELPQKLCRLLEGSINLPDPTLQQEEG